MESIYPQTYSVGTIVSLHGERKTPVGVLMLSTLVSMSASDSGWKKG